MNNNLVGIVYHPAERQVVKSLPLEGPWLLQLTKYPSRLPCADGMSNQQRNTSCRRCLFQAWQTSGTICIQAATFRIFSDTPTLVGGFAAIAGVTRPVRIR